MRQVKKRSFKSAATIGPASETAPPILNHIVHPRTVDATQPLNEDSTISATIDSSRSIGVKSKIAQPDL